MTTNKTKLIKLFSGSKYLMEIASISYQIIREPISISTSKNFAVSVKRCAGYFIAEKQIPIENENTLKIIVKMEKEDIEINKIIITSKDVFNNYCFVASYLGRPVEETKKVTSNQTQGQIYNPYLDSWSWL